MTCHVNLTHIEHPIVIHFNLILVPMLYFHISVMFAFEQALLCLGHHPDIWIEAATYLENASKLLTEKGVRFSNHL